MKNSLCAMTSFEGARAQVGKVAATGVVSVYRLALDGLTVVHGLGTHTDAVDVLVRSAPAGDKVYLCTDKALKAMTLLTVTFANQAIGA